MARLIRVHLYKCPLSSVRWCWLWCWLWWLGLRRRVDHIAEWARLHPGPDTSFGVERAVVLVRLPCEDIGLDVPVDLRKGDADGTVRPTTIDEQVVVVNDIIT